jgi:CRISPR-associated protein Cmr6
MHVVPKYQRNLLDKGMSGNFSLVFARGTQWREDRGQLKAEFQSGTRQNRDGPVPVFDSAIVQLGHRGAELLPHAATVLQGVHQRQHGILQGFANQGGLALEIRARLTSPFVSGLGSGHPTETGMILDRNTGMPYIPASAIKGVLRLAHAVNILRSGQGEGWIKEHKDEVELDDREPSLRKYFGDTDAGAEEGVRGQLVFLDAFPENPPCLKADIMNPHFHKYYGENQPPVDCEDPIPVKFLSVESGTVFVFRVLAAPLARPAELESNAVEREFGQEDEGRIRAMFNTAFDELGFGGKTSVGYGRFQNLDGSATPGTPDSVGHSSLTSSDQHGTAKPAPGQVPPAPPKDPETERLEAVTEFERSLPKRNMLPSEMDRLIESINRKDDEETRRRCCETLLRFAQTDAKGFKKAKNGGKQWAVKLADLCTELGVAVS